MRIEVAKMFHSSFKQISWLVFVRSRFEASEREFFLWNLPADCLQKSIFHQFLHNPKMRTFNGS